MNKYINKPVIITFVTFFIVLHVQFVTAQAEYQVKKTFDNYRTSKAASGEIKYGLSADDIYGNPYLENEFTNGTIYTVQKIQYIEIPVRYNMYSDVFEFRSNDENYEIGVPTDIEKIEFNGMVFHYIPYFDDKKLKYGYFRVIESGKASLYARYRVIFKKMEHASITQKSLPNRFEELPIEYFFRLESKEAKSFNSKKELIDLFPENRDKIETFITENKVKPNNSEKLAALFKFFNSL